MGLQSVVVPAKEIEESEILAMVRIMQTYYLNVDFHEFQVDLKEKDMVILLYENKIIRGFSTWMLIPYQIQDRKINIIFSGDTIIDKNYWHSLALPISWGRLMLSTLSQYPDSELYWLLTSKGYKTYRFLPIFFREFYPTFTRNTPSFETAVMNSFASYKFGDRYNPSTGILTAATGAQKLAPGVADITEIRRKDGHIVFFERMNPNHARGDELVCLARCQSQNINPFILRYLKQ